MAAATAFFAATWSKVGDAGLWLLCDRHLVVAVCRDLAGGDETQDAALLDRDCSSPVNEVGENEEADRVVVAYSEVEVETE